MAELTDFTDYDSIRAALGVSDEEIEDVTLALPLYAHALSMDLMSFGGSVEQDYLDVRLAPSTDLERKFVSVVQMFSTYSIARHLLTSLPLFAPKKVTDGRASYDRFSDPLEAVRQGVELMYASLRQKLSEILGDMDYDLPVARGRSYFAAVGLGYNPITNE